MDKNSNDTQPDADKVVNHKSKNNFTSLRDKLPTDKNRLILLGLIVLAIPLTVGLALVQQEMRSRASGADIASVAINPGSINSSVNGQAQEMSALAYDSSGNPIFSDVHYQWSMSSTNSVGTLSRTEGEISQFMPLNSGCGSLTVTAISGGQTVSKSTIVAVSDGTSSPECLSEPMPSGNPSSEYHRVFVTSVQYNGNLGGLSGADAKCQARANAVNLGGTWKAWLSDDNTNAPSRLNHSSNPYKLLDGRVIANNWDDLVDKTLQNPINLNELKLIQTLEPNRNTFVWTNTWGDGRILGPYSCKNWTSPLNGDSAIYGNSASSDLGWTFNGTLYCNNSFSLYCFEQTSVIDPTPTNEPTPTDEPTPTPTLTPTPTNTPTPTPIRVTVTPSVRTMILNPSADAFVRSNASTQNFGTVKAIETGTFPTEYGYLKFNLSQLAGKTIKKATLKVRVSDPTAQTQTLRRASVNNWNESTITYNKRTAFEAVIRTFSANTKNQVLDLQVTNAVNLRKGGNITFGITSAGNDPGAFYSRESAAANRPQLVVEYQ